MDYTPVHIYKDSPGKRLRKRNDRFFLGGSFWIQLQTRVEMVQNAPPGVWKSLENTSVWYMDELSHTAQIALFFFLVFIL